MKSIQFVKIDIKDQVKVGELIQKEEITAVVSCLPYFCNESIADTAFHNKIQYFDLTEDIETSKFVRELSSNSKQAFVPQCGLAPGFINIIANDLMQKFDELDSVKLRCGGLPINASNELKYAFTWSVDGLINEYNKPCESIKNGKIIKASPLENKEEIQIDGLKYEAFNTSGGIGSLTRSYKGKLNTLNYKTIRYPGHCDRIRFLMQDLKLGQDTETLKKILLNAMPHTTYDVVIVFVSVNGKQHDKLEKISFVRKYYPVCIDKIPYSALQITTAASASAVINIVMHNPTQYQGYIEQEEFQLNNLLDSPFGQYLQGKQ